MRITHVAVLALVAVVAQPAALAAAAGLEPVDWVPDWLGKHATGGKGESDFILPTPVWSSPASDDTTSLAWGDGDGDGDLDLAVGVNGGPNRVYVNHGGVLGDSGLALGTYDTFSVAWGDVDGDGDLDLATGNYGQANRVYINTGATLVDSGAALGADNTTSVAWGDWDNDGDLDLACGNAGNYGEANKVYENAGGSLNPTAVWSDTNYDITFEVAWGDWDGDGDLELAAGNGGYPPLVSVTPSRVYENGGGSLPPSGTWTAPHADNTRSVAWADYDGDGDLDLAVGSSGDPNRIYRNDGGSLADSGHSLGSSYTFSVAWGDVDGDGDPDLVCGNFGQANRIYANFNGTLLDSGLTLGTADTRTVVWGDWDGDGDLDLIEGNDSQPDLIYDNDGPPLSQSPAWSAAETDDTWSLAWADWDGDGDLDLVAGNDGANRVYENNGGALDGMAIWSDSEAEDTRSVAWGDVDGDDDMDLVVGNVDAANRVYSNTAGVLSPAWSSAEVDSSMCVAWGDWDGDGDLDLAAANSGNSGEPNRVYENINGVLASAAVWSDTDLDISFAVAWGDWDSDGDLDLGAGNGGWYPFVSSGPNRVYQNGSGSLPSSATWSSADADNTHGVAWGDWDGDGDLDLATANGDSAYPNHTRVYGNSGVFPFLSSVWTSADQELRMEVAWADVDGDGDLDLAAAGGAANSLYTNSGASLSEGWTATDSPSGVCAAWGDVDDDGDLDLAVGKLGESNVIYENQWITRPGRLPETPVSPVISQRPGSTDTAYFHSAEQCLASPITISYTLVDDESDPARRIVPEYSVDSGGLSGGGTWHPATEGPFGDGTLELPASPSGTPHVYAWDAQADGVVDEEQVVFRITVPAQASMWVGGPIQRGAMRAVSPPFRICQPMTDLFITKTDGQAVSTPGEETTYTITVGNIGPEDVAGARVVDTFDAALLNVAWTCSEVGGGSCGSSSGVGHLDETVTLAVGQSVEYSVTATIDPAIAGVLVNTATVEPPAGWADSNPGNNQSTDVTDLIPAANLSVMKTDGLDCVTPGQEIMYTITVASSGPSAVRLAQVTDLFPQYLVQIDWSCDPSGGGTCGSSGGSGDILTTVDLPPGSWVELTATALVVAVPDPGLSNTATIAAPPDVIETDPSDNSFTDFDLPCALFDDGFESGLTDAWSATVGWPP